MKYTPGRVLKDPSLPSLSPEERRVNSYLISIISFSSLEGLAHTTNLFLFLLISPLPTASIFLLTTQAIYEEMCHVLVAIHKVDITTAQLSDFGKQGTLDRIMRKTKRYMHVVLRPGHE